MHVLKFPLSWKLYLVKLLMQKVILECIFDVYIILSVLFFTYIVIKYHSMTHCFMLPLHLIYVFKGQHRRLITLFDNSISSKQMHYHEQT